MHPIQPSTTPRTPKSRASVLSQAPPSVQALSQVGNKCQILAKKGYLTARNLTSGVALLIYSEEFQLGVLLQLPPLSVPGKPAMRHSNEFAKPALAMILAEFEALGVAKADLVTYAIGGSTIDGLPETSRTVVRRMLWSYGLVLSACDLGGSQIRSIWMDVENGRTIVRSQPSHTRTAQSGDPLQVAS